MHDVNIGGRVIGEGHPPFIIAEMSGNHNGSLEQALKIADAAAASGAHALKLQTYTADTMTLDIAGGEFFIDDPKSLWRGMGLYDLYKKAHTPWQWHEPIFERCKKLGLICFSTPFDGTAVDFLESLAAPAYKIASFENTDLPLIKKAAATGKPLIISTGMATVAEIDEAVRTAREGGCVDIVLLKCTSTYPASAADSNILTIPHMRELFDVQAGLSDHTLGTGVSLAAVALGATVIEKHFTISRADGGVDAAFSMEPDEMRRLVFESKQARQALGGVSYGPTEKEKPSLKFRRSLYIVKDMEAGEVFTAENVRAIRPGFGLPPKYLDVILGKKASRDLKTGTALTWEIIG
jgi:pseudaminic acid synthase